jgi:hypothetical protein
VAGCGCSEQKEGCSSVEEDVQDKHIDRKIRSFFLGRNEPKYIKYIDSDGIFHM